MLPVQRLWMCRSVSVERGRSPSSGLRCTRKWVRPPSNVGLHHLPGRLVEELRDGAAPNLCLSAVPRRLVIERLDLDFREP